MQTIRCRPIAFARKVELCQAIDAAARARDPRVAQVSVASPAAGRWSRSSAQTGSSRPTSGRSVASTCRSSPKQGDRRETGSFGLGGRYLYDQLFEPATWNRAIDEALAQALVNLESVPAPAAKCRWCWAPAGAGCCCTKRSAMARRRFQPQGHVGIFRPDRRRVAAPGVTVIDEGAIEIAAARSASTTRARRPAAPF
jgi:TldD protein